MESGSEVGFQVHVYICHYIVQKCLAHIYAFYLLFLDFYHPFRIYKNFHDKLGIYAFLHPLKWTEEAHLFGLRQFSQTSFPLVIFFFFSFELPFLF